MCPPDAVTSGSARKPRAANPARVVAGQAPATTHESGQGNAVRRDITGGRTSPATRGRWHPGTVADPAHVRQGMWDRASPSAPDPPPGPDPPRNRPDPIGGAYSARAAVTFP